MAGPSPSHKPPGVLLKTCCFLVPGLSLAFSPSFAWRQPLKTHPHGDPLQPVPIRASTFPSVQWYTICFFPVTYTVVGFPAVCATRVGGRVVFPNQSVLPMPGFRSKLPRAPFLSSCLKYNIVKLWDNLENAFSHVIMALFLLRYSGLGNSGICNVRKKWPLLPEPLCSEQNW